MTDILQPVAAVILVLGLLGSLLVVLRRRGMASFSGLPGFAGAAAGAAKQMKVVERIPLGAQHSLHLVRVGERLILVATGPGSCQIMNTDTMAKGDL